MCEEREVPDYLLRDLPVAPDPKQFPPDTYDLRRVPFNDEYSRVMRRQSQAAKEITVVLIASVASFLMGLIAGFIAGYF